MKRFSLIVSLAACLILVLGSGASAVWKMEVQDKNVSPGQTGVTVDVTYSFDVRIVQASLPLIVRTDGSGAFWAGLLPYDTFDIFATEFNQGIVWNPEVTGWAGIIYTVFPGPMCTGLGGTYGDGSPDGLQITTQGSNPYPNPTRPNGVLFLTMSFDVNSTLGCFEFDTACWSGSINKIFMIDLLGTDHGPAPGTAEVVFDKGVICILPNPCPSVIGAYTSPVVNGNEGQALANTHNGVYSDPPDNDAAEFYKVSGPGTVNKTTGAWSWTPACGEAGPYTVVVEVSDAAHGQNGCPNNLIQFTGTVAALPINLVCPADVSVHFGNHALGQATEGTICDPVTFSADDGNMTAGGAYDWLTDCQDLGQHTITVTATETAQGTPTSEQCTFKVTVTNTLPDCNVQDETFLYTLGYSEDLDLSITDADGDGLAFSNLTIAPVPTGNQPSLGAGNVVTWNPSPADAPGTYHLTVTASDGCQSVICEWDLTLLFAKAYKVSVIDTVGLEDFANDLPPAKHYASTLNGRNVTVGVSLQFGFVEGTGAFDLLLCYDQSVLAFKFATKGSAIAGWEYFTYRYGPFGNNCGSGCPSGYIRIISIRDMNNGVTPPLGSEFVSGFVAFLTFYVSEDRSLIGLCPRIGFCSIDCGDNVISDVTGDKLALAFPGQNNPQGYFITFGPDYDLDSCLAGDKGEPESFVYFDPGFICIIPPPDDRGDINLNGIANEVADAVLFTNYFIYGPGVWDPVYFENQILATDINDDGIVLTVADLVYLIRIITGDAQPFPASGEGKLNPYAAGLDVSTEVIDGRMVVTTNSFNDLGAGYLVFRYTGLTVGTPSTGTDMTVKSHAANGEFRVLVYSMSGNRIEAGVTQLVTVPVEGEGTIELAEASFSDVQGSLMTVELHSKAMPTTYELAQNYPNPFNASTVIRFALPVASNWTLNIYNVAGQVVETFSGSGEGFQSVTWKSEVASGIYFYKLTADNFTATKKMVLMK